MKFGESCRAEFRQDRLKSRAICHGDHFGPPPGLRRWATAGFTLIELLVVVAVISILAALLLPVLGKAKERGKGTGCLNNLYQIGLALRMYVEENGNRMPNMYDRGTNSIPGSNDIQSVEVVLTNHLGSVEVLRCPSDNDRIFELTGSSYAWAFWLNGQNANRLKFLDTPVPSHAMPVFYDKQQFHTARGPNKAMNFLYADGHTKSQLEMEGF